MARTSAGACKRLRTEGGNPRYSRLLKRWVAAVIVPALVLWTGVSGAGGLENSAASAPAAEVFALTNPGDSTPVFQAYLNKPSVSGLAYRATWSQMETANGAYAWSGLDDALDATQTSGKRITLHIGVSGGAWPAWLTTAGVQTYSGATPLGVVTDPVPWDAPFVAQYAAFMQAMAQHIQQRGQTGLVRSVSVGAPVSEMSLVACNNGVLGSTAAVAYDRAKYLNAWTATTSAVAAAFPQAQVFVSAPVATLCRPDTDGRQFYADLLAPLSAQYANLSIFAADLNAAGSQRLVQAGALVQAFPIGLQTIWSATGDPANRMAGTLSSAVCAGRAAGARCFEIYQADLDSADPAIQTAIQQALGSAPCPCSGVCAQFTSGWWYNPAEGGRGFFIEQQGGSVFLAAFLYDDSGRPTWLSSGGSLSGAAYSGPLDSYAGGQTLGGAYTPPAHAPSPGTLTLQFADSSHATLSWPGGTTSIQRFPIVPGGLAGVAASPQSGWYWNPAEGGRGFAIEIQNGNIMVAGFMYDAAGRPLWYVSQGPLVAGNPNLYQGQWVEYANGQTLSGAYKAPLVANPQAGALVLQFTNAENAILTLPNGQQTTLTRFRFAPSQNAVTGM